MASFLKNYNQNIVKNKLGYCVDINISLITRERFLEQRLNFRNEQKLRTTKKRYKQNGERIKAKWRFRNLLD